MLHTIEFHDPCTCISNNFWTFLCEAHAYLAHVKIIRLSDVRPREHVDSGHGGGRHIGITGPTPT